MTRSTMPALSSPPADSLQSKSKIEPEPANLPLLIQSPDVKDSDLDHASIHLEEIKDLRAQLVFRKSQLWDTQEHNIKLEATLKTKEAKIMHLTSQLSKNTDLILAKEQLVALEQQIKDKTSEVSTAHSSTLFLEDRVSQLGADNKFKDTQILSLEERISELRADIDSKDAQIANQDTIIAKQTTIMEKQNVIVEAFSTIRCGRAYKSLANVAEPKDHFSRKKVNAARNSLCHDGQWYLDHLLVELSKFPSDIIASYSKIYDLRTGAVVSPHAAKFIDMKANMVLYRARTDFKPNVEDVRAFTKAHDTYRGIYAEAIIRYRNDPAGFKRFFDTNREALRLDREMRNIEQKTKRAYLNHGRYLA